MITFYNAGEAGKMFSTLEVVAFKSRDCKVLSFQVKSDWEEGVRNSRTVHLDPESAQYLAKEILRVFPAEKKEQGYTGGL